MHIGITVGDLRGPICAVGLVGQVRAAAAAGLATAWSAQAFGWDALTALAAAGVQVPEIGLGTAVVPTPQRHPLVLAGQALSVQAATGNRLTLGIGAGVGVLVKGMFGQPVDRPARRMREYLTALRPLLRGQSVAQHGELITAVGEVNVPGARPPAVLLAALGPRMLRLAGELADGTITWMTGPRTLADHIVPTITTAARAADRPGPRIVAGFVVCVTEDVENARARIGEHFGLAGQVPEYRAVLDREGAGGPADVAIVGDEDAVVRDIRRLADIGVSELIVSPFGTAAEQSRTIAVAGQLARTGDPISRS